MANPLLVAGVSLLGLVALALAAQRVGQSVIPTYILAGVALGPFGVGLGTDTVGVALPTLLSLPAALGVVLLLFFVGLELSVDELLAERRAFALAGGVDVGVSLPLGFLVGLAVGFTPLEAGFLALVVFNSSTVIIAKSVVDAGWLGSRTADAIFGVVVVEDIVTALLFAVLSALVAGGSGLDLARSLGVGVVFLLAVVGVTLRGADRLGRAFRPLRGDLFVVAALGVAAFVAGLGALTRTSEAVAAFLAGGLFQNADLTAEAERYLAPVRDVFAVVFFVWVGVQTDPRVVADVTPLVLGAGAVTLAGQLVSGYYAGRAFGLDADGAVRMGAALTPRGEFSLVIAAFLTAAGTTPTLSETIPAFTVGYVLLTSVAGSVLLHRADDIAGLRHRVASR
ncbi:cation:proton antiporter [Halomicroarcula sp. F13]|uniref:Cation:proton antiporter n=1 Tax=Haloarcula rubra TaxID=2487747 RepID=A0AAW4PMW5_9EURY|nr:cation:proton antiporter [Halomicroarcula rubra]MBX0322096.1 cation:proton antiporter [Halomicroarcula rubra]